MRVNFRATKGLGQRLTTLEAMDKADAFFTHTVVGAPMSVMLGHRLSAKSTQARDGIDVDLPSGTARLSQAWQDWVVLRQPMDAVGRPRRLGGRILRWMARNALWLACLSLLGMLATASAWAWWFVS